MAPKPQGASARNMSASTVAVNTAMDLVANNLSSQLTSGATAGSMMATSVGSHKVTTGSHVKSYGGSIALGVSKGFDNTLVGVFVEGGLSHFDSFDEGKVGSGNGQFAGFGALVKLNFDHVYVTSGVHGGVLKTKTNFKTNTNYIGAYGELGWHATKYIDTYMRYSYSHTGSIEETFGVDTLIIDATTSHRGRLGAKFTLNNYFAKPYLGAAVEHEFQGKTKGVIVGDDDVAVPTTKGTTGIIEFGLELEVTKHLLGHLNVEACFGRRQGFSGGLGLEYRL